MTGSKEAISKISFHSRLRLFFIIVPSVFMLDYASKYIVQQTMVPYGKTINIINDLLKLRFIYNEGIAFGMKFGFASGWALILVSSAVALLLITYFFLSSYDDLPGLAAISLIAGGALGNLTDRIFNGRVVDFIECGIKDLTWPVFNVADIAVTCGALLLTLRLFFADRQKKSTE
jgi:signal peptidase II